MMDKHVCASFMKNPAVMSRMAKVAILNADESVSSERGRMAMMVIGTFGSILEKHVSSMQLKEVPAWSNKR